MGLLDRFRRSPPASPVDEPPGPATAEQLHALFDRPAGTSVIDDGRTLTLEHLVVGELVFPTGRIAFCDPLVGDGTMFVSVAAGAVGRASALGVRLAPDHLRVAALALDLAPGPVASWRMYVPDGETVEEGSIWGFGVDAGVGCFADPAAIEALRSACARYYDQPGELTGPEPVVDAMYRDDGSAYALIYDVEPGLQLAISESGWGDGLYATHVGTDADGGLVRLIISYDVISADHVVT